LLERMQGDQVRAETGLAELAGDGSATVTELNR
jgi:hypothetical protein